MSNDHRLFISHQSPETPFAPSNALLMGAGNSSVQSEDSATDKNWMSFYLKSTGASGTSRGMYLRLYLPNGAGGEAFRAFTTVSAAAPADTVNGAHISLNFGSSAGNVTGEGQAVRATFHLGNRTMTGTLSAIKAEVWSDGTGSNASNFAFMRFSNGGNATGLANIDTNGYFFNIDGLTEGADKLLRVGAPVTLAASLRCKIGATNYFLPLYATGS